MTRSGDPNLFCFGLGFSAQALARLLPATEWTVCGTVRTAEKSDTLKSRGIDAVLWTGEEGSTDLHERLAQASHVLVSAPPNESGDPVLEKFTTALRQNGTLEWLGYLSTTGVYGDTGGAVVTEASPTNPSSARSQRRVDAENAWLKLHEDHDLPVHIFRLAGIYGPGRSVFERIRQGKATRIDKPGHAFSRIHVDDIARVLNASIAKPNPGAVYNVCDNEPAPPADVTAYACQLLNKEPPPLEQFDDIKARMSPMALSFWDDNRRVDNSRIKAELGVELQYPNYRSGLAATLAEEPYGTGIKRLY